MQQSGIPQLYPCLYVTVSPSCQFILLSVKQLDYQRHVPQKTFTRKCVRTLRQLAVFPPQTSTCIIRSRVLKITMCGRFIMTLYRVIENSCDLMFDI